MGVASRAFAATVGGFAFTSAAIAAFAFLLPGSLIQNVIWASLSGFALWTGAAIWIFAARTAARAWAGLLLATAIPTLFLVLK